MDPSNANNSGKLCKQLNIKIEASIPLPTFMDGTFLVTSDFTQDVVFQILFLELVGKGLNSCFWGFLWLTSTCECRELDLMAQEDPSRLASCALSRMATMRNKQFLIHFSISNQINYIPKGRERRHASSLQYPKSSAVELFPADKILQARTIAAEPQFCKRKTTIEVYPAVNIQVPLLTLLL